MCSLTVKEIDFHKLSVEDAEEMAADILDDVRLAKNEADYKFITGRNGAIQRHLMKFLTNAGCDVSISLNNPGVLLVHID